MGFLTKMFTKVTHDGIVIDTLLTKNSFLPGEEFKGEVHVTGGNHPLYMKEIELCVVMNTEDLHRHIHSEVIMNRIEISVDKEVGTGEKLVYPFAINLHKYCPVTMMESKAWVDTVVDMKGKKDEMDMDVISIKAPLVIQNLIDAISTEGFRLDEVENKWYKTDQSGDPVYQTFKFKSKLCLTLVKIHEVEVGYHCDGNGEDYSLIISFEEKTRNLDEQVKFELSRGEMEDLRALKSRLNDVFMEYGGTPLIK